MDLPVLERWLAPCLDYEPAPPAMAQAPEMQSITADTSEKLGPGQEVDHDRGV